jgi:subtilisin
MGPSYGRPTDVKAVRASAETLVEPARGPYRGSSGVEGGMTMDRSVLAGRGLIAPGVLVVVFALLAATFVPTVAGASPAAGGGTVKAIVTFDARPGTAARSAIRDLGGSISRTFTLINGMAIDIPANAIAGLRRNPLVASVELDATLTTLEPAIHDEATGDLEYDNAWGVTHIGSKSAHDAGVRGAGIKVAVIDTGIDYIHDDPDDDPYVVDPEFTSNYAGGWDFVNNDNDPMDDNGHGTHVAGILAAEKNGYLVVGVAPEVDLYAIKILDATGQGQESNLIAALQWAVDHDIDLVNISLGTHEVVPALQTAVENAAAAGLLMVAASGNTVTFEELLYGCPVAYPGAYPQVLSTTFTNQNDALTGYSCTGPEVDFASPGDYIFSPVPIGPCQNCSPYGYAALSGTSMASPHLAGSVALLLDAGIADTGQAGLFDDIKARLCATANQGWGVQTGFGGGTQIPPSDPRYAQYFGCGVVDAGEAVLGHTPPPSVFHIGDLDGSTSTAGKSWTAKVTIRVEDAAHVPLSGVVVAGAWSNGASGSVSCTTTSSGTCTVQKTKLPRATIGSVTFTVTGATRSGFTYAPASNHDPDPDSNGTSIVVLRPA